MSYQVSDTSFEESMEISHKKEVINLLILHVLQMEKQSLRVKEICDCINEHNNKAYSFMDLNQAVYRISLRGFLAIERVEENQHTGRYCKITNEGKMELSLLRKKYLDLTCGTLNVLNVIKE